MSVSIPVSSQHKKPFHHRKGSDEIDVFEAARYFSGATENFSATHKNSSGGARNFNYNTRPFGRISLDMPNHRDNNVIPLKAMLMENQILQNSNKEKKSKQPSSPGGKLAHFLNSLFNQNSSKKSKSKTKDEDQSPGGWRRKRRSSISNFTTTTTATVTSNSKSSFSTSTSSGFTTPPPNYHVAHTPSKSKIDSYRKPPPTQITKIPNKIEDLSVISNNLGEKNINYHNGFLEKVRKYDGKQEDIKEYKRFLDDDGADSDSSSDLFELTNCDLGYSCSSGLPVYETTRMDISIKRGAPISS